MTGLAFVASIALSAGIVALVVIGAVQLMRRETPRCPRCNEPIGADQVRGDICHSCLARWPWPT